MTYQEAVDYINHHGKELSYDKENGECIVYIAPTDPVQEEEFNKLFVLNNYSPGVILPYINQDVCVKRVFKKGLLQNVFIYELIVQ